MSSSRNNPQLSSGESHISQRSDPFLARTDKIRITEKDRQEGYDVDLLKAKPRGSKPATGPSTSSNRYGTQSYESDTAKPAAATGALAATTTTAAATDGVAKPRHSADGEKHSQETETSKPGFLSGKRHRRRWFLRPLVLLLLVLIVLAIALGIGLGVGLGTKKTSNRKVTHATTGTVYTSTEYTTTSLPRTSRNSSTTATDTSASPSSSAQEGSIVSIGVSVITNAQGSVISFVTTDFSSTAPLATTGNIPIPIGSQTTRDGTVISSMTTDISFRARGLPTMLAPRTPPPAVPEPTAA